MDFRSCSLILAGKRGVSAEAGLRWHFTSLGLLGQCCSEVASGPRAGRRRPGLTMSSVENVEDNWRQLLGKLVSCINQLL